MSTPFFQWLDACSQDRAVHLVVPSMLWGRELPRRLSAHGVRAFGCRTTTVETLAERVASKAMIASGRQRLSDTGRLVLVREAVLRPLSPDPFGVDVRSTPGFISIAANGIRALRAQGVTPADLSNAVARAEPYRQDRMAAMATVLANYIDCLEAASRYDEGHILTWAIAALKSDDWFDPGAPVALVGQQTHDGLAQVFLDTLEDQAERLFGQPLQCFTEPLPPAKDQGRAVDSLRAHLFEKEGGQGTFDDSLDLLPCGGARGEFDAALRFLIQRAGEGVPWSRQAILVPTATPYGHFLQGLDSAGLAVEIPMDNHVGFSLAETRPGRGLLGLLSLVGTPLSAGDFFTQLATGQWTITHHPVFQEALPDDDDRKVSAHKLQSLARKARIVAGEDWGARLLAAADHKLAKALEPERSFKDSLRKDARLMRALSAVALDLQERLDALFRSTTLHHACGLVGALLDQWMGRGREQAMVSTFASELRQVPQTGMAVTWADAHQFFVQALHGRRAPTQSEPGGVLVAEIDTVAGLDFDSAVIMGLAERAYPPPPRRDALLPNDVCDLLGFTAQSEVADRRRKTFKATCSGVHNALRVSWPAVEGNEGVPRVPSSFALAVELAVLGDIRDAESRAAVPRLPKAADKAVNGSEHWLRRILDNRRQGVRDLMDSRPELSASLERNTAVFGRRLSDWEGVIPPDMAVEALEKLRGGSPSVTGFEQYAKCPSGFFFKHLLGLDDLDEPAEAASPDALEIGSALHRALETFMEPYITASPSTLPPDDEKSQAALEGLIRAEFDALNGAQNYIHPGEVRRVTDHLVTRMKTWLTRLDRSGDWAPHALEMAFGTRHKASTHDAYRLAWDGGHCDVRGEIDRVDVRIVDGVTEYRVMDYKSSKRYPKVNAKQTREAMEADFLGGTLLQFGAYALAVEQVLGHPVTVTGYDYVTPGTGNPMVVTIPWNADLADKMKCVLENLMESMRAGLFSRGADCIFCRPKGICGTILQKGRAPDDPLWDRYRAATGTPVVSEDEMGGAK
jgi:RecB family exonuclease